MNEREVVTVFLSNVGDVLLLRRSEAVGSYSGRWGGVAGHVEDTPETAARREIREETGLGPSAIELVNRGESFTVTDTDLEIVWTVHPFRFSTDTRAIEPNWETAETAWVDPPTIREVETVPDLWTSWDQVRPTLESVTEDTTSGSATISRRALEVVRDEATLAAEKGDWDRLVQCATRLREARDAMAVVRVRIDQVMTRASERATPEAAREASNEVLQQAIAADNAAAEQAAEKIDGRSVFTLSRSGTVERAIETARPESIAVAVSRPGEEGADLAAHLAESGHAVTVYEDANIPRGVRDADVVLVGADTVLANGDSINKTGTMAAALAAARFDVPAYVAAATAKISPKERWQFSPTTDTKDLPSDQLSVPRAEHPFERTPSDLIQGVITEEGILEPSAIRAVAESHAELAEWMPNR